MTGIAEFGGLLVCSDVIKGVEDESLLAILLIETLLSFLYLSVGCPKLHVKVSILSLATENLAGLLKITLRRCDHLQAVKELIEIFFRKLVESLIEACLYALLLNGLQPALRMDQLRKLIRLPGLQLRVSGRVHVAYARLLVVKGGGSEHW